MKNESLIVRKESKKSVRDVDIKPMIHRLELLNRETDETIICITTLLSAGSSENLKPELLFTALREKCIHDISLAGIHRTGLYILQKGRMVEPLDPDAVMGHKD